MTTLKQMLEAEEIIAVDDYYLTDDGIILVRVYGRGTSMYWLRNDDQSTVYRNLFEAYSEHSGIEVSRMRRDTRMIVRESIQLALAKIE